MGSLESWKKEMTGLHEIVLDHWAMLGKGWWLTVHVERWFILLLSNKLCGMWCLSWVLLNLLPHQVIGVGSVFSSNYRIFQNYTTNDEEKQWEKRKVKQLNSVDLLSNAECTPNALNNSSQNESFQSVCVHVDNWKLSPISPALLLFPLKCGIFYPSWFRHLVWDCCRSRCCMDPAPLLQVEVH